jgi:predicted nucleic acid-binding protein
MTLVDTGPLVALFDKKDAHHARCVRVLKKASPPLVCTTPVLTEAFHMLGADSHGAQALCKFIERDGLTVWHLSKATLNRSFALMRQYADHPMDLADASLVVAAEVLNTERIFTIDRNDFAAYRIRRGHGYEAFEIVP